MPDVLMEAARLMGQSAEMLLAAEGPTGIRTLVQKLGVTGCCGVAREAFRPVTLACVEQLAKLSFYLLCTRSRDVRSGAREIRSSMSFLAKLFLAVPDTPLFGAHTTFLGPYYSATSMDVLSARLAHLANAINNAKAEDARQVIENIEAWADGLYQTEKDLLLEAVTRRSQFTFDMVCWIRQVTSILLAVSNATE
jgi:bacterioferritin-associated ferredoxin